MALPRLSVPVPEVISLFDYAGYQRKMLDRIICHEGFMTRRVNDKLYEVLCLRGTVLPEWLKTVHIYHRTPGYLYFSMPKGVDVKDDCLYVFCLPFVQCIFDENVPLLGTGINIASPNTSDARCLPGSAIVGRFNHPALPP